MTIVLCITSPQEVEERINPLYTEICQGEDMIGLELIKLGIEKGYRKLDFNYIPLPCEQEGQNGSGGIGHYKLK
jgi:hypothetical protein